VAERELHTDHFRAILLTNALETKLDYGRFVEGFRGIASPEVYFRAQLSVIGEKKPGFSQKPRLCHTK